MLTKTTLVCIGFICAVFTRAKNHTAPAGPGPVGPGVEGERKDNLRNKPLSGKLQIQLKGARELDHAPIVTSGRSRSAAKAIETYVSFKVEGTQRARSHPTRTDRWMEDFEITVDKANEVEIAVFDKQIGESHPVPIGLLWIKINDLVEAQRRQKVMAESGAGGWVTANAMNGDNPVMGMGGGGAPGGMDAPIGFSNMGPSGAALVPGSEGVEAWFAVEPAGALALQLNFSKWLESFTPFARLIEFSSSQGERPQAAPRCPWRSRSSRCRS